MSSFWNGFYKKAESKDEKKPVSMAKHIGGGALAGAIPGSILTGGHAAAITGPNVKWKGRRAKPKGIARLGLILGTSLAGGALGAIPGAAVGAASGTTAKQLEKRKEKLKKTASGWGSEGSNAAASSIASAFGGGSKPPPPPPPPPAPKDVSGSLGERISSGLKGLMGG